MLSIESGALGIFSLVALLALYLASADISTSLSPQGCRMSWMSPSSIPQVDFDTSWTPLARRYSLWLYREDGWDTSEIQGLPVLFIPGNAGSFNQVRSIASSATRQFYSSPGFVAPEFASRTLKPLDFFAVDFNEDLSAFHGATLEAQISYTSQAISYILSLYPPNTAIIVMGHSMGGIVGASLPSDKISALFTMSTPYTLPPARFDSRVDDIYGKVGRVLETSRIAILSLCGGATDMMIPSEACIISNQTANPLRKTVFTSALEGAWTGVGHREMVWCHQVRWRVARAAIEMGATSTPIEKARIMDKWLRDGHTLPTEILESKYPEDSFDLIGAQKYEVFPENVRLELKIPQGSRIYLLPAPANISSFIFSLFVSQGSILSVSPYKPLPMKASVFDCTAASADAIPRCTSLKPKTLKLIPNPIFGKSFPVPDEGSDESEGVALYEAEISLAKGQKTVHRWVGVKIEDADGRGWVFGGFTQADPMIHEEGMLSLLFGSLTVYIPVKTEHRTSFSFPRLLSNALLAYRITPIVTHDISCNDDLLPPIIMHTSHLSETHYFPLINKQNRRIILHTHVPAPHISSSDYLSSGVHFTIFSSGDAGCLRDVKGFTINIDWSATFGRLASRYVTALVSWSAGIASFILFCGWGRFESTGEMPAVDDSIRIYIRVTLRYLVPLSFLVSFLPLPESYYLGNKGNGYFAPLAPFMLVFASGLVCVSWRILSLLIFGLGKVVRLLFPRRREKNSIHRTTLASMCIIFLLVFLFVPWQVAFLGCWQLHLYTCASSEMTMSKTSDSASPETRAIPLVAQTGNLENDDDESQDAPSHENHRLRLMEYRLLKLNNLRHSMHLLLLMTWLLPLAAPVLVVWVRTLATVGLTTPFDGDHLFLNIAPFLVMVDFASWTSGPLFEQQSAKSYISIRWVFALVAVSAFLVGSRKPYVVFDVAKIAVAIVVIIKIGRRYWGGASWFSHRG